MVVKSLSEAHPDLGLANAPVDVQLYVDGRLQVCAMAPPAVASIKMPVERSMLSLMMAVFTQKYGQIEEGRVCVE